MDVFLSHIPIFPTSTGKLFPDVRYYGRVNGNPATQPGGGRARYTLAEIDRILTIVDFETAKGMRKGVVLKSLGVGWSTYYTLIARQAAAKEKGPGSTTAEAS